MITRRRISPTLGLAAGEVTPLENALDDFEAGFNQTVADKATAQASTENKDALRKARGKARPRFERAIGAGG